MVHGLIDSPSPRVRHKRAARRREILSAALGLVEARGLDALTVKLLADELDYAIGALYRYFPSKGALIGALQRHVVGLLDQLHSACLERCRAASPPGAAAPLVPLCATAAVYLRYAAESPGPFGLLALSLADPRHLIEDEQASAVLDAAQPIFERIAAELEAAAAANALASGPAMDRAIVLWASLHGVAQLHKLARLRSPQLEGQRLTQALLEALLVGWGAEPAHVCAASEWLTQNRVV